MLCSTYGQVVGYAKMSTVCSYQTYLHNVLHNEIVKKMQMNAVWVKLPSYYESIKLRGQKFENNEEFKNFIQSNCPL